MKRKLIKLLSVTLIIMILLNFTMPAASADEAQIEAFIERLYELVLDRESEPSGLAYWSNLLSRGERTGSEVAASFFFSNEMILRKVNDKEFINILYYTLMDRSPEESGAAHWEGRLADGWPRTDIFGSFVASSEFKLICDKYGIVQGSYKPPMDGKAGVFATRLYQTTLERAPDPAGLEHWTKILTSGSMTGTDVAYIFLFGTEMKQRDLGNNAFVEILFNAMMGRPSDEAGRQYWINELNRGIPRENVFSGFVRSIEFGKICSEYGIIHGSYTPPPIIPQDEFAIEVIRLVNEMRINLGFEPLILDRGLQQAAVIMVNELVNSSIPNRDMATIFNELGISRPYTSRGTGGASSNLVRAIPQDFVNFYAGPNSQYLSENVRSIGLGIHSNAGVCSNYVVLRSPEIY